MNVDRRLLSLHRISSLFCIASLLSISTLLFLFISTATAETSPRLNPELFGAGRCSESNGSSPCSPIWQTTVSATNFCSFLNSAHDDPPSNSCAPVISDFLASQPGVSPQPDPAPFVPRDDVASCTNIEGVFNCTDAAWLYCQQYPNPADCRILGWNPCHFWQSGDAHEVVIRPGTQPNEWCIVDPTESAEVYCWIAPNGPTTIPDEGWERICEMRSRMGMNCPPGHRGVPPHTCFEILPGDQYDSCGAHKRRWDQCGIPAVIQDYCDYINERPISCPSLPTCSSLLGELCGHGPHPNQFWGPSIPSTACRDTDAQGKPKITFLNCDCEGISPIRCYWKRPSQDLLVRCDRIIGQPCTTPGERNTCRRAFTNPSQKMDLVCSEENIWMPYSRPRPTPRPDPATPRTSDKIKSKGEF